MYPMYSQRDSRWGDIRFSKARLSIKDWGCTLTVLASMATWAGKEMLPGDMAGKLKYNDNGELFWNSLPSPLKFVYRYDKYVESKARSIAVSEKGMCLIQVQWGRSKHWVGLIGWNRNGAVIHDPFDGKKKELKSCPFYAIGMAELTK